MFEEECIVFRAHWHGELAVRMIKPHQKLDEAEFLQQLKKQVLTMRSNIILNPSLRFQVSRLRKVRHEYLNLYTGVCGMFSFNENSSL